MNIIDKFGMFLARKVLRMASFFGVGVRPLLLVVIALSTIKVVVDDGKFSLFAFIWASLMTDILRKGFFPAIKEIERSPEVLPNYMILVSPWWRQLSYLFFAWLTSIPGKNTCPASVSFVAAVFNFFFSPYFILAYAEDKGGKTLKDMVKSGVAKLRQLTSQPRRSLSPGF